MLEPKTCVICGRRAFQELCDYHSQAKSNLQKGFERWQYALGSMSWTEYLNSLLKLDDTGIWVKEVIRFELKEG